MTSSIIPDRFSGTDYEKVQAAINEAILRRQGVEFDRLYNITGKTITINKTTGNRIPLRLFSNSNGGIRKTDAGYVFVATNSNTGDLFLDGVTFESIPGAGTIIYKCPNIIRVHSHQCSYVNVDTIIKTEDRGYMQSMRFTNENITGGKGYAFDFGGAYDSSWTNVVIEHREHGFIHRGTGTDPQIFGCRIRDCILEGLQGTAIELRNCNNLVIDGCYFEYNKGGHIIVNSTATQGLTISNCRHGGLQDVPALIQWKGIAKAFAFNNIAQNIAIHDTTGLTGKSEITSLNDITQYNLNNVEDPSIIEGSYPIYRLSPVIAKNIAGGNSDVKYGAIRKTSSSLSNISLASREIRHVTFTFQDDVSNEDILSVQAVVARNVNVTVCNYYCDSSNRKLVYATIKNEQGTAITVQTLKMTRLKFL